MFKKSGWLAPGVYLKLSSSKSQLGDMCGQLQEFVQTEAICGGAKTQAPAQEDNRGLGTCTWSKVVAKASNNFQTGIPHFTYKENMSLHCQTPPLGNKRHKLSLWQILCNR